MDLKEQFENVEIMFEGQTGMLKHDELCEATNKCVEIANSYAIGFSVFCMQELMDDFESNKPSRIETMGDILERYNSITK